MSSKREREIPGSGTHKNASSLNPPFKKARYEWEIKRTRKKFENSASDCLDVSDDPKCSGLSEQGETDDIHICKDIAINQEVESTTDGRNVCEEISMDSDLTSENVTNFSNSPRNITDLENNCETEEPNRYSDSSSSFENSPVRSRPGVCAGPLIPEQEQQKGHSGRDYGVTPTEGAQPRQPRNFILPAHSIISESLVNLTEYVPLSSDSVDGIPLSHQLERLQNRHISKAIVDNAINHTLEDMGICPNTYSHSSIHRRVVETDAINCAIRSEGLQMTSQAQPTPPEHNNSDSDSESEDDDLLESEFQDTCNLIQGSQSSETSLFSHVSGGDMTTQTQSRLLDDAMSVAISSRGLVMRNT